MGTGIELGTHITVQARAVLERADSAFYLVTDPAARAWIEDVNPRATSLDVHYQAGVDRRVAYERMVEALLTPVRKGWKVGAAFYGHPGVFVAPSHEAVRRARVEGYQARLLPGITAEDCLVADLGIDPARTGWQSYEATDFLVHGRAIDPSAALVLWQVGVIGTVGHAERSSPAALEALSDRLARIYPEEHEAVLYVASPYPGGRAVMQAVGISELADVDVPALATLFVPPGEVREPDLRLVQLLGA